MRKITIRIFSIFILAASWKISNAVEIKKVEKDIKEGEFSSEKKNDIDVLKEAVGKALRWKLKTGDVIEIRKKSIQDIQISNEKQPKSIFSKHVQREVINRIILNTLGVDPVNGFLVEGSFHSFVNYKDNTSGLYQEEDSQDSTFYIQPRGIFIVPPGNYMPNIRNIPVFPLDKDPLDHSHVMKEGDTWQFPGIEIMRVEELENIPMDASYEYIGKENINVGNGTKTIHKILYNVQFNHNLKKTLKPENPRKIFGYVMAKLIWDEKEGMPYYMTEDYDIVIMYNNGINHEFHISSKTNYLKKQKVDLTEKNKTQKEITDNLNQYFKKNEIDVQSVTKGISIRIPDVLFNIDTSDLNSQSIKVLQTVSRILKKYMVSKQILIRGHTDNTGTIIHNQELSNQRAMAVAKYLADNYNIPVESLSYEGVGSDMPLADNNTPSGRQKNRRVEIILLDN
ncbi:MAG: OmpA family protein [Spirochaetia bacterium]|nr:OmpA family protein [Spirochaetia bacterium]